MNITTYREWLTNVPDDLLAILKEVNKYGFEVRIVGGAVRDIAMGIEPRDIDLATDALPEELMFILNKYKYDIGISMINPKGIEHGTIVVTTESDEEYEITSLAYSIKDIDDRLKVSHHRDWKADALRRDFTMNSMSLAFDGKVYDYLGGLRDLANEKIKFNGFYKLRMVADPVMILRFAKFCAKLEYPNYNPGIVPFIKKNPHLIEELHQETIDWFVDQCHNGEHPYNADPILLALGVRPSVN